MLCGVQRCLSWPCLALTLGGLHIPHLSSRDSLYLSQPTPKGRPPLPFLDLWFARYSSSQPQLPWQQHMLGPAGKSLHSKLAPAPGSRQAWAAGRTQAGWLRYRTDWGNVGILLHGGGLQSRVKEIASFLSPVNNKSLCPRMASAGRLTPRWFLMAYVPTARRAWALPTQPPQRIPSLGMGGAVPNPRELECVACSYSEQWSAESEEQRDGLSAREMLVQALKSETERES